jgi:PIN like domain
LTVKPGHPDGLPDLLLDRSLGSIQVPTLLRAAGLRLHTLVDVYGSPADEDVEDPDWLSLAGQRGWPVLMKDQRIRYRPAEREAVIANGVQAFCLSGGNLKAASMADRFLQVLDKITEICRTPGPALHVISASSIRKVLLDP